MGLGRQAVLDRPEPTDHHAGQQHHDHGRNRVDERQYEGRDARAGVSFTWSLMRPQLEAIRAQYTQMGFHVPPECQVIRRFWGRLYFNMSLFQQAAYTLYGTTPDKQIMQLGGAAVQVLPPGSPSRWQRLRWLGNALRFGRLADRVRQAAPASFAASRAALAGITFPDSAPRPCRVAPAARHVLQRDAVVSPPASLLDHGHEWQF